MNIISLRLTSDLEVEKRLGLDHDADREKRDYSVFPYITHSLDFDTFLEDQLPWHWQQDVEIIEATSGAVTVRSSKNSHTLYAGELCAVSPHTLHQILPASPEEKCTLDTHLFQPDLISGGPGNALDVRYVSPILNCREADLLPFTTKNPRTVELRSLLHEARQLCEERGFAYEFDVRARLTEVWKILYLTARPLLAQRHTVDDRSEERMQAMLNFIQNNYMEKIGLAEIAGAATISERECLRCFQKTLRVTPIHYLQNYRVRTAARRLLETDDTVLSICQSVGFSDNSYFGRIFQQYLHCSPSQFRKRHRQLR